MAGHSEEWVEIGFTGISHEAVAWRDLLLSTGIQVRLVPEVNLFEIYPGTTVQGPFRLFVKAGVEAEARAALDDIRYPPHEEGKDD